MKVDVKDVAAIIRREFGIDQPVDVIESMIINSINTNKKAGEKPKKDNYRSPTGHDLYEDWEKRSMAMWDEWRADHHG